MTPAGLGAEAIGHGAAVGLVARLWRAMDLGRHEDVLGLLTPDCRWFRDGAWQEGAAAVGASLCRRPVERTVRHLLTNFVVEPAGTTASVGAYLLAYDADGRGTGAPLPLGDPFALADLRTVVVSSGAALRVREIDMDVVFLRSAS